MFTAQTVLKRRTSDMEKRFGPHSIIVGVVVVLDGHPCPLLRSTELIFAVVAASASAAYQSDL